MTIAWTARTLDLEALLPRARIAVTMLCLLGTADLVVRNRFLLGGVFGQDPVDASFHLLGGPKTLVTDADSTPFQWGSPMLRALMNGKSFYRCYEGAQLARKADTIHPLIWLDGDAKIFTTRFSPNRIHFTVSGGHDQSRVRLNQNFAVGWRSDAGVVEPDPETGQPSIVLGPGTTGTFSFVFVPPGLFLGCGLGLAALGASAYGWRRKPQPSVTLRGWCVPGQPVSWL
jgi:hypothetical protein